MVVFRLLFLIFLLSCATSQKKDQAGIRSFVSEGNYTAALLQINESKSLKEPKNELLFYMERGAVNFYLENYYQSVRDLSRAKEIADQLYLSIKGKTAATLFNENTDQFYGEVYERSQIHYLLSLNHYLLSQRGFYEAYAPDGKNQIAQKDLTESEKRSELFAARAELVAWDSYLKSISDDRVGKSIYKADLLSKVFGAMVHEAIGTRDDLQIALQLYIDAKDVLFKNYNTYQSFNSRSLDFKKDYEKLPTLQREDVVKNYLTPTLYQKSLHKYLDQKIVRLAKLYRKGELKQLARQNNIDEALLEKIDPKKDPNLRIILSHSIVDPKVGQEVYIGLKKAIEEGNGAAKFGATLIALFAAQTLKLLPPPNSYNPAGVFLGVNVAELAVKEFAISFELPRIDKKPNDHEFWLVVKDSKGNEVEKSEIPLINPLGDIAEEAVSEGSVARYSRLGSRLAIKHATAIAASYATYKALGGGAGNANADFIARNAAVVQYVAAAKGIAASESADTRFWSTLPRNIHLSEVHLPIGEYQLFIKSYPLSKSDGEPLSTTDLGKVTITKDGKAQVKSVIVR